MWGNNELYERMAWDRSVVEAILNSPGRALWTTAWSHDMAVQVGSDFDWNFAEVFAEYRDLEDDE